MRLTVERFGDLHNNPLIPREPGKDQSSYEKFIKFAKLLGKLQREGKLRIWLDRGEGEVASGDLKDVQVTAAAGLSAAKAGYKFRRTNDRFDLIKPGCRVLCTNLKDFDENEAKELRDLLGIESQQVKKTMLMRFTGVRKENDGRPALRWRTDKHGVVREVTSEVQARSFLGVLDYVAQGIEVPAYHRWMNLVKTHTDAQGNAVDWRECISDLLNVRCSLIPPIFAYASVHHRGHWFYIDDTDTGSKDTFALLGILLALQAGEVKAAEPVLTVPVTAD